MTLKLHLEKKISWSFCRMNQDLYSSETKFGYIDQYIIDLTKIFVWANQVIFKQTILVSWYKLFV